VITMSLLYPPPALPPTPLPPSRTHQQRPSSHPLGLSTIDCQLSCTLLYKSEAHPIPFQSLAHSTQKHPGVTSDRSSIFRSPLVYPEPRRVTRHSPLPKPFIRNTYKNTGEGACYPPPNSHSRQSITKHGSGNTDHEPQVTSAAP
jgi:hypothetical protein